jgi:hypothetical protein
MIVEIYNGNPDDPNYNEEILEISNEIDLLLQEIRMLFDTENGDVINEPNFGIGLEDMLFEFNLNENQLKRRIDDQIKAYCDIGNLEIKTDVKFFKGSIRDAAQIDIFINGKRSMGLFIK